MSQQYSDPSCESDMHALPDVEVFYRSAEACAIDDWEGGAGWYYWYCFPGCLPDSDAVGPFATEQEAIEAAQDE